MDNLNFMVRGSIAFFAAALVHLFIVIRNNRMISKEIDSYAKKSPNGMISEEQKGTILVKTHKLVIKPLKSMIFLVVLGAAIGIIGIIYG